MTARPSPTIRCNYLTLLKVLEALVDGPLTLPELAARTSMSVGSRHGALTAGRLGLAITTDGTSWRLSAAGRRLAASQRNSNEERAALLASMLTAKDFLAVWQDAIRTSSELSARVVAEAITRYYGSAEATASWYAGFYVEFARIAGLIKPAARRGTYEATSILTKAIRKLPADVLVELRPPVRVPRPPTTESAEERERLSDFLLDLGRAVSEKGPDGFRSQVPELAERGRKLSDTVSNTIYKPVINSVVEMIEEAATASDVELVKRSFRLLDGVLRAPRE